MTFSRAKKVQKTTEKTFSGGQTMEVQPLPHLAPGKPHFSTVLVKTTRKTSGFSLNVFMQETAFMASIFQWEQVVIKER